VARLDDLDALTRDGMAMTGDDDAFEIAGPQLFKGARHRGRRLSGADNDSTTGYTGRQSGRNRPVRVGRGEGGVEEGAQEFPGRGAIARFHVSIPPCHFRRHFISSAS